MYPGPDRLRRCLVWGAAAGLSLAGLPAAVHADTALRRTVRMTAGPFYPDEIPLDHDNDLIAYGPAPAKGRVLDLAGRVLDERGRSLDRTRVEIWQCDANGRYHHVVDGDPAERDPGFQGYGEFTTAADGRYRFRTISPVPYGWRTAHIHFRLSGPGFEPLTTQMFVAGAPRNRSDGIYNGISDPALRAAVTIPLRPNPDGAAGLSGTFDIVLAADGRYALL